MAIDPQNVSDQVNDTVWIISSVCDSISEALGFIDNEPLIEFEMLELQKTLWELCDRIIAGED